MKLALIAVICMTMSKALKITDAEPDLQVLAQAGAECPRNSNGSCGGSDSHQRPEQSVHYHYHYGHPGGDGEDGSTGGDEEEE